MDLEKRVENLTELERCFVELGKALLSGCHLIIVDNPANYLSQYELFEFQQMLKKIRKEGISVLYVGNHHQELFKIADRTALFSDGHIYKVFERDEMTDERWHRTSQNGRSCPRRMIRMPRMTGSCTFTLWESEI